MNNIAEPDKHHHEYTHQPGDKQSKTMTKAQA